MDTTNTNSNNDEIHSINRPDESDNDAVDVMVYSGNDDDVSLPPPSDAADEVQDISNSEDEGNEEDSAVQAHNSAEIHHPDTRAPADQTFLASGSYEGDMASVSNALAADLNLTTPESLAAATRVSEKDKSKECCICSEAAIYTCPGCGRRTCSITCVRVHKATHACSGERDVAAKVPLSEFTDEQLRRDYNFLEDCRRVISNADRCLHEAPKYNFKALPAPLRALREAAKKRGVVCQIMSQGMAKRAANTSSYDAAADTVTWRCEFVFHAASSSASGSNDSQRSVRVATQWGNERHLLGDILRFCWAKNPLLPTHPIDCSYNHRTPHRAAEAPSNIVEGNDGEGGEETAEPKEDITAEPAASTLSPLMQPEEDAISDQEDDLVSALALEAMKFMTTDPDSYTASCAPQPQDGANDNESEDEEYTIAKENYEFVRHFLTAGDVAILSRAERLGNANKYMALNPDATLNEALRCLFFVNEYPVFDVVRKDDILAGDDRFPLVSAAEKDAIRDSFRAKEKPPPLKKGEIDPELAERLSQIPCRMHQSGACKLGDEDCPYWHCLPEEVPLCRIFVRDGRCPRRARCSFRHDPEAVDPNRKRPRSAGRGNGRGRGRGRGRGNGRGRGRGNAGATV